MYRRAHHPPPAPRLPNWLSDISVARGVYTNHSNQLQYLISEVGLRSLVSCIRIHSNSKNLNITKAAFRYKTLFFKNLHKYDKCHMYWLNKGHHCLLLPVLESIVNTQYVLLTTTRWKIMYPGTVHVLCVFTITKCICCFDSKIKSLMTRNWLSIKGIIFTFWSNYSYLCYWYHTLQESFRNQKSLLVFVCLNNCIYIVLTIGKFKIISTKIWG